MRTLIKIGFGLLVLAVILIGLMFSVLRSGGVNTRNQTQGREVTSETRPVTDNITEIELTGAVDMTLRQGAVPSMTVRGEKRLLGNVDTVKDGNTLQIGIKGMLLHKRVPLQVVLTLPSIDTVRIKGSGDSTINGFSGDKLDVQLDGSGSVKFNGRFKDVNAAVRGSGDMEMNGGASDKVEVALSGSGEMTVVGSCKEFKADQTGSGDLDARHLAAEAAEVILRGSGTSVVQASRSADVTVRGSGDVRVLGNPSERVVSRTGTGGVNFNEAQ
jgi:mannose-6-phosphate isomerase-like protein (cupin superfamily)